MFKRMLSLALAALLLLAVCCSAAAAEEAAGTEERYVYTENGNDLNVRSEPNGEIVGKLKYGDKVTVISYKDANWATINFTYDKPGFGIGEWPAYVNRRFLIDIEPAELAAAVAQEKEAYTGDPLMDICDEFNSATDVENYRIMIRPARVTSWVNMRWIPCETGMIIASYKATEQLVVLKELKHYLQVQDPDTGDVGYIHKMFAVKLQ